MYQKKKNLVQRFNTQLTTNRKVGCRSIESNTAR